MRAISASVRRILAVLHARNLEYLRDRASFGWNLLFPVLIVMALAVVFSGPPRALFSVPLVSGEPPAMLAFPGIETLEASEAKALDRLSRQQTDLVLKVGAAEVE